MEKNEKIAKDFAKLLKAHGKDLNTELEKFARSAIRSMVREAVAYTSPFSPQDKIGKGFPSTKMVRELTRKMVSANITGKKSPDEVKLREGVPYKHQGETRMRLVDPNEKGKNISPFRIYAESTKPTRRRRKSRRMPGVIVAKTGNALYSAIRQRPFVQGKRSMYRTPKDGGYIISTRENVAKTVDKLAKKGAGFSLSGWYAAMAENVKGGKGSVPAVFRMAKGGAKNGGCSFRGHNGVYKVAIWNNVAIGSTAKRLSRNKTKITDEYLKTISLAAKHRFKGLFKKRRKNK